MCFFGKIIEKKGDTMSEPINNSIPVQGTKNASQTTLLTKLETLAARVGTSILSAMNMAVSTGASLTHRAKGLVQSHPYLSGILAVVGSIGILGARYFLTNTSSPSEDLPTCHADMCPNPEFDFGLKYPVCPAQRRYITMCPIFKPFAEMCPRFEL